MKTNYKILSVGGSIINPPSGFDIPFLKKFRKLILDEVKKGQKFILVIGGGASARNYQQALAKVTKVPKTDLDWMGIAATNINAKFVQLFFGDHAYKDVISDPRKKVKTNKSIIIAAGWKPGCSTDNDGVLLAKTYGVKHMLNLSNIAYAYDKDPNKYKSAKKIESMDWATFIKEVVGTEWDPGKSLPFDPIASKTAKKIGLSVSILNGTDLANVKKALNDKKFNGSYIH